jgi:hypothetical protein
MIDTGVRMRENAKDSLLRQECGGLVSPTVLEISNKSEFISY